MTALDTSTTIDSDEARVNALVDQLLAEHDPQTTDTTEFLGHQFDLGLAWVHFPVGRGGLGLGPKLQNVVNNRLAAAGAPSPYYRNPIGYGMGAPTDPGPRQRRPEGPLPAAAVHRRGDLVPAVQRARRRIRRRRAVEPGRA